MSKDVEIKSLVLNLGGKDVSLTVEQAKRLFKALEEMFGSKEVVVNRNFYSAPWRWPYTTAHLAVSGVDSKFEYGKGTLRCSV